MLNNTIVALSTPPFNGAIHIIRLSGNQAYEILNKIILIKIKKESYRIQKNTICENGKKIDEVLLMKFVSPKSFTGEDLIEINCHGGIFIANKIIELLIKNGAKIAQKGEFSKRAFMNKKISLNQANAINNLINATNEITISNVNNALNKRSNDLIDKFSNELFKIIGQIEVNIDYPEYEDSSNKKNILNNIKKINKKIIAIISHSKMAMKFNQGFDIAIIGKPNVGKSSLLNAFINEDKAIVSSIPGTTRDVVETKINMNGITINILDTAGIRNKTNNKIEKIGINKSYEVIKKADLILFVVDGTKPLDENDKKILNHIKNMNFIIVNNKVDIKQYNNHLNSIKISAKQKQISNLIMEIKKRFNTLSIEKYDGVILQSQQIIGLLENTLLLLEKCFEDIKKNTPIDLVIENMHEAFENILKIQGRSNDFNFIDEMFKNFCLGK
ncbi:MAG: tRNA uridine-5-carboxymethylaminomethyl(34) synthesis GTPase MnmE [Mycoplasmataceae bacterium]|jgi:tRNA modification GTPase|nr:tRNA uridine-5-carboxymethylaminomethyl(34) synthesis GTPase MnmE [Mycoplasmataceae bacterium]